MFRFFKDYLNYAYTTDGPVKCACCQQVKICYSKGITFRGEENADICFDCMKDGALIEEDEWQNNAYPNEALIQKHGAEKAKEMAKEITYCTPSVPTWQDMDWPILHGDFCVFTKIAAQPDFENAKVLYQSIPDDERYDHSAEELWEMLPEKPISNLNDGNYDVSFYLFESDGQKVVLWDAN